MIMELTQATHYNYFDVFSLLCFYYVIDMIKKLELRLLLVIILFKIEFGNAQIIAPKSIHRCRKQPVPTPALSENSSI